MNTIQPIIYLKKSMKKKKNNYYEAYIWIIKVIISCKTLEQTKIAINLINNFRIQYDIKNKPRESIETLSLIRLVSYLTYKIIKI